MPVELGRNHRGIREIRTDVVIVGSGAGGGMAAHELALAGAKVLVLEEGPWVQTLEMNQREDAMLPLLYQDRGGRTTADRAIRVLGGRCLGGSTVHNTNLCKRAPAEVLEHWAERFRVSGLSPSEMALLYEGVERTLSVSDIEHEARNPNNLVLARGLEKLGWRGGGLRHNRKGCVRSGFCDLGCPFDAKENSAKTLIPVALAKGAVVMCDARADRVVHDGARATGVVATTLDANGTSTGELRIEARAVVLAGSAIGSSALVLRSGIPDRGGRAGKGIYLHPGVAVAGLFDERIDGWKGIPQSVECTELLDFSKGSLKRVWITTAFAHPVATAVMLPGFGPSHREWMRRYANLAVLTAMVHDETSGFVRVVGGNARVEYELGASDREQLDLGVRACARLLFAAGARRVLIPRIPALVLDSSSAIDKLPPIVEPHGIALTAVHPMGGLGLGDDPGISVMQSSGEHHALRGLFAADGSLFPSSIGVPPQLSIYALARRVASFVSKRLG